MVKLIDAAGGCTQDVSVHPGGRETPPGRTSAFVHPWHHHGGHLSSPQDKIAPIYCRLTSPPVGRPGISVGVPVAPVPSRRSYSASSRSRAAVGEATGSLIAAEETARAARITAW